MNFSDSISAKRRAYRSRNRNRPSRRRLLQQQQQGQGQGQGQGQEGEFIGDGGSDSSDEEETPERKLTRLRREVEELKIELSSNAEQRPGGGADDNDGVLELSRALDNLHASSTKGGSSSAATRLSHTLDSRSPNFSTNDNNKTATATKTTNLTGQETPDPEILTRAAAFDGRLALIEAAMGIARSSSNPFLIDDPSRGSAFHPVLPALDNLSSRLSSLTSILTGPPTSNSNSNMTNPTTTPNLETLEMRVRKLTVDAEALEAARKRANEAAKVSPSTQIGTTTTTTSKGPTDYDDSGDDPLLAAAQRDEQTAKIHALYTTLPTIQSLYPTLPSVLERLRSLRAIHAGAAEAAESLDAVERRQDEANKEIEKWREGLKVVEEKVGQGEIAMKSNIEVVEPWVKDLETRLNRLELDKSG